MKEAAAFKEGYPQMDSKRCFFLNVCMFLCFSYFFPLPISVDCSLVIVTHRLPPTFLVKASAMSTNWPVDSVLSQLGLDVRDKRKNKITLN